jgi:hypothetical protein
MIIISITSKTRTQQMQTFRSCHYEGMQPLLLVLLCRFYNQE